MRVISRDELNAWLVTLQQYEESVQSEELRELQQIWEDGENSEECEN